MLIGSETGFTVVNYGERPDDETGGHVDRTGGAPAARLSPPVDGQPTLLAAHVPQTDENEVTGDDDEQLTTLNVTKVI